MAPGHDQAYAQPNKKTGIYQLVAKVREVGFGDLIHIAFSTNGGYERLGSFEILDNDHPDQEGPIDHGKHGRLSLFRVCEKTPLGQMLAGTTYRIDPKLGVFTGWHVREVELREIAFFPGMFPGNGSLHPVTPGQESPAMNSLPSTRGTLKKPPDQLAKGKAAPIALPKSGRFIGVDWSGALRAGRKIWAAAICCTEEKPPKVEFVKRPFTGLDAGGVASKFADWLESESFVAAGLDFCFGVSESHLVSGLPRTGPAALGRWIADRYRTPQDFKSALGREDKRATDRNCGSPFAPTNLRMFRQTYWGLLALADVKLPILPWGDSSDGAVIIEILPAQVAKTLCRDCRYKGRSSAARLGRQRLLKEVIDTLGITISANDADRMVNDADGDALDSVLAAIAAAAAKESGYAGVPADSALTVEGWIYSVG